MSAFLASWPLYIWGKRPAGSSTSQFIHLLRRSNPAHGESLRNMIYFRWGLRSRWRASCWTPTQDVGLRVSCPFLRGCLIFWMKRCLRAVAAILQPCAGRPLAAPFRAGRRAPGGDSWSESRASRPRERPGLQTASQTVPSTVHRTQCGGFPGAHNPIAGTFLRVPMCIHTHPEACPRRGRAQSHGTDAPPLV